jgi:hypothetical protein
VIRIVEQTARALKPAGIKILGLVDQYCVVAEFRDGDSEPCQQPLAKLALWLSRVHSSDHAIVARKLIKMPYRD